jgi:hypothetical protein
MAQVHAVREFLAHLSRVAEQQQNYVQGQQDRESRMQRRMYRHVKHDTAAWLENLH